MAQAFCSSACSDDGKVCRDAGRPKRDVFLALTQIGNKQFFSEVGEDGLHRKKFRTSGNVVSVLTALSVSAYICLLVLTLRLKT